MALIGGIFAAGQLEAFKDWVLSLHQRDVARLAEVSFTESVSFGLSGC